jgi:glycosyltransferase involved in cell wall biosynthesis
VAVVANLRDVKDPFRAEESVRELPRSSRLRVRHAGVELERGLAADARRRAAANPRYRWLGSRPPWQARRLIAASRLLVLSSRLEGGANVISEAVVAGVPVLATRIACAEGLLGEDYPGLFPVGGTRELRELLLRAEGDARFRAELARRCRALRPSFAPTRERRAWKALLEELAGAWAGCGSFSAPRRQPAAS